MEIPLDLQAPKSEEYEDRCHGYENYLMKTELVLLQRVVPAEMRNPRQAGREYECSHRKGEPGDQGWEMAEENLEPNDEPGSFDLGGCRATRLHCIITCRHGQREAEEYEGQDHNRQELPCKEFTAHNEPVIISGFGHLRQDNPLNLYS